MRRSGNRLRFTGQLIDATSGAHIWADRFEGEMSDVFDLQDRITESVVAAIEPNLQRAEIERLKQKPTANLGAYDLLLRAQQLEYEFTAAKPCGSDSVPGTARLPSILPMPRQWHWRPIATANVATRPGCKTSRQKPPRDSAWPRARSSSARTTAMSSGWPPLPSRHLAMDAHRAKQLADRSLQLNPNSAIALAIAAWIEVGMGNWAKALELARRAERLSPRDPRGWFIATVMGLAHFHAGQFDEAESLPQKGIGAKLTLRHGASHSRSEPGKTGAEGRGCRRGAGTPQN